MLNIFDDGRWPIRLRNLGEVAQEVEVVVASMGGFQPAVGRKFTCELTTGTRCKIAAHHNGVPLAHICPISRQDNGKYG